MGSSTEASAPMIVEENVQTGAPQGAPPPYVPSMTTEYNACQPQFAPQPQLPYPPVINNNAAHYYPAQNCDPAPRVIQGYPIQQQQAPIVAAQPGYSLVPQQPQIQSNTDCPQFNEDPPSLCPLVFAWVCVSWPCGILACVYYFRAKKAFDQKDKIAFLRYNNNYKITAWIGIIFVLIICLSVKYRIRLADQDESKTNYYGDSSYDSYDSSWSSSN